MQPWSRLSDCLSSATPSILFATCSAWASLISCRRWRNSGRTAHALNPISSIDFWGRLEAESCEQRQHLQGVVETDQQQALEADSAARAESDFLAHKSHELQTALNAKLGFTETIRYTLLGPIDTGAYRDYARHTHESGEYLLPPFNDILTMSRIESGKMELDKGDGRAIKQIMIKLLSNAAKFTSSQGRIDIDAEGNEESLMTITVIHTDVGTNTRDIARILEPLIRLEQAETGTGLCLPLAKSLVELHGGELLIQSQPGI